MGCVSNRCFSSNTNALRRPFLLRAFGYHTNMLAASASARVSRALRKLTSVAAALSTSATSASTVRVFENDIRQGLPDLVGNTPLIRLRGLSEATGCNVRVMNSARVTSRWKRDTVNM